MSVREEFCKYYSGKFGVDYRCVAKVCKAIDKDLPLKMSWLTETEKVVPFAYTAWNAAKELYAPKSQLERDGMPTFYLEPHDPVMGGPMICTHRLSKDSIAFWTTSEGYEEVMKLWEANND